MGRVASAKPSTKNNRRRRREKEEEEEEAVNSSLALSTKAEPIALNAVAIPRDRSLLACAPDRALIYSRYAQLSDVYRLLA